MKLPADKSTKSALRGKVYIWGQRETNPLLPSYLSVVNRRRADALYSFDERRRTGQQFRTMYITGQGWDHVDRHQRRAKPL